METKKSILLILFIGLLSWGINLLNGGYIWDDWVYFNLSDSDMKKELFEPGYITFYYYCKALFFVSHNPLFHRFILFILIVGSSILNYLTLLKCKFSDRQTILLQTIILSTLPFMHASVSFITANYYTAFFLFSVATYWFISNQYKPALIKRIGYILFFFLSFFTNSFITFIIYPLILVFLSKGEWKIKSGLNVILKNIDIVLVAVFFMIIKSIWLKPTGKFVGYNEVNIHNLLSSPVQVIRNTIEVTIGFFDLFNAGSFNLLYLFFIVLILYFGLRWTLRNNLPQDNTLKISPKIWIIAGIIIFGFGILPYSIAFKTPYFTDMESRHQILLPFGTAFILTGLFLIIKNKFSLSQTSYIILVLIFSGFFISINQSKYASGLSDWLRQESIIENLKKSEIIKNNSTFLLNDNTSEYNMNNRNIREFEYNGYLHKAFGNETRNILPKEMNLNEITQSKIDGNYNIHQYVPDTAKFIINFDMAQPIENKTIGYMLYWYYFRKDLFRDNICNYTRVSVNTKK